MPQLDKATFYLQVMTSFYSFLTLHFFILFFVFPRIKISLLIRESLFENVNLFNRGLCLDLFISQIYYLISIMNFFYFYKNIYSNVINELNAQFINKYNDQNKFFIDAINYSDAKMFNLALALNNYNKLSFVKKSEPIIEVKKNLNKSKTKASKVNSK